MSSKNKRNNVNYENDSESSSTDGEPGERHPDAYDGNEKVLVNFEGRMPMDPDCDGISQLLSRLFLKAPINCMEMAKLIIAQNYVGSVIYQAESDSEDSDDDMCDDGTIFGITTVINIAAKKNSPPIQQLRKYVLERAEKNGCKDVLNYFRNAFDDDRHPLGFLLNERFINIPTQISVPLFENLNEEIRKAKDKGMPFDFSRFLMIVKFYRSEAKKGKAVEDTFTNAEEELLCSKATNFFEFPVENECDSGISGDWLESDAQLTPYRKILLFDSTLLSNLASDIKKFIEQE